MKPEEAQKLKALIDEMTEMPKPETEEISESSETPSQGSETEKQE